MMACPSFLLWGPICSCQPVPAIPSQAIQGSWRHLRRPSRRLRLFGEVRTFRRLDVGRVLRSSPALISKSAVENCFTVKDCFSITTLFQKKPSYQQCDVRRRNVPGQVELQLAADPIFLA